jgi:hypothetical protein
MNAGGKELLARKVSDLGDPVRRYDSSSMISRSARDLLKPLMMTSLVVGRGT